MPPFATEKTFRQAMERATRLTGMGKLLDATRVIQRALFGTAPAQPDHAPAAASHPKGEKSPPSVIVLPAPQGPHTPHTPQTRAAPLGRKASFTKHAYSFEGSSYPYRLYIPSATEAALDKPMPLVVLLHGCKQDAFDFAQGTAMNTDRKSVV